VNEAAFASGLTARVSEMLDACTGCGKCVEVCPIRVPAGIATADPKEVIAGTLDIVRTGEGPEASRIWATSCVLDGECVEACDYGVNPRFLLSMARVAMAQKTTEPRARRKTGVENFRAVADGVNVLARMQLACSWRMRSWRGSGKR
jgi:heterodisulfide reductase subunit D